MATYGRGQMLGSGINPESFKLDYSGMANAAATQAQGVANLGASIGGAISEVGDYFKKQKEDEQKVQKSLSVAKAIGDLIPGLKPTIKNSLNILNDKEIPLSQRTAEADAIADILNLGINEVRNRQDVGFKERELNIQEAQFEAENAPPMPTVNRKRVEKTGIFDGKTLKYDIYVDPNNPSDALYEDGTPVYGEGSQTPAAIDAGLNLSFPQFESVPDGGVLNPLPNAIAAAADLTGGQSDVSNVSPMPMGTPTTTQAPVVDGIPASQAGTGMIPPGAIPIESEAKKPLTTSRIVTGEEAQNLGGDSNKKYIVEQVDGETTSIQLVPPDVTPAEQRARQEEENKKIETKRTGELTVNAINKFIDEKGNYNDTLNRAVGYGEEFATGVAKVIPFFGTQSPKDRTSQKELSTLVEKGLLDAAKELKPISNADLALLLKNRPAIADPPELWASWLKDVRNILRDPNSYAESKNDSTTNKPQTLEEQLDSMIKGNQ
jgi:hypothetical protein